MRRKRGVSESDTPSTDKKEVRGKSLTKATQGTDHNIRSSKLKVKHHMSHKRKITKTTGLKTIDITEVLDHTNRMSHKY